MYGYVFNGNKIINSFENLSMMEMWDFINGYNSKGLEIHVYRGKFEFVGAFKPQVGWV